MKLSDFRWLIIVAFFALSMVNIWFGLFGFVCMATPIIQALIGNGKIHCQKHCPRGSFFAKVVSKISLRNSMPKFMLTNAARNTLLVIMMVMFAYSMYHSQGEPKRIAFGLFRLMGISFIVGIVMGVFYKPKSWCAVCPMGHAANMITNAKKGKKVKESKQDNEKYA